MMKDRPEHKNANDSHMPASSLAAIALSASSTWVLKHVFRRPAANFPGKIGLYADPRLIAHLRNRIREGSIVVVGTNGKTTVTNLIADAIESSGKTVVCNRTGANLDSGIATALLHATTADWGVFESDELWLAKVVPDLQPDFVVLLNLFRDQLDRSGEIEHVQEAIVSALRASSRSKLVYNADDPFCQAVADRVLNPHITFGVAEDMRLPPNSVSDSGLCQHCSSMLEYEWRQYGQLGSYRCPHCSFCRTQPHYAAASVDLDPAGISFAMRFDGRDRRIMSHLAGAYSVYNLVAACAIADQCRIDFESVDAAIRGYVPENGRLQAYDIGSLRVILNLAKNPTGLNQNLRIVCAERKPTAVAFFINDKEADGHDVSWLWDADFQELAASENIRAYAGGIRRNDMQVRLKYAGVEAQLVDGALDFMAKAQSQGPVGRLYVIANYTALPHVKAELDEAARKKHVSTASTAGDRPIAVIRPHETEPSPHGNRSMTIMHVYPELLNLYGDGGNVAILAARARARGIAVTVDLVEHGEVPDFETADIVFLGGGPDREQQLASSSLLAQAASLRAYVEDDGVLLAICGGFQILGSEWLLGDEVVEGLGLVDFTTKRAEGGSHNRIVGNVALHSMLASMPVIGYENHAGRTHLGPECEPFGRVIGKHGTGNNDSDGVDGVIYRNVIGTYLHGPLLAKNPEIADWLIERSLERRARKEGRKHLPLVPLDDAEERTANGFMSRRLGVSEKVHDAHFRAWR